MHLMRMFENLTNYVPLSLHYMHEDMALEAGVNSKNLELLADCWIVPDLI